MGETLEKLKAADYFREVKEGFIPEQTVEIAGKSQTLSKIAEADIQILSRDLDDMLVNLPEAERNIYLDAAVSITDAVRMVNTETKQGFVGSLAVDRQLDLMLFRAKMFYDPDNAGVYRTSWLRSITSAGEKYFIIDSTGSGELTMAEEEGIVLIGFKVPEGNGAPCADAFQCRMNTIPWDIQNLSFGITNGIRAVKMKEPWILPPEQSGWVKVYYSKCGLDAMEPLGVWIKMSKNNRTL